jgi:hypothetical protein
MAIGDLHLVKDTGSANRATAFVSWSFVFVALTLCHGCSQHAAQPAGTSGSQDGNLNEGDDVTDHLKELQPEAKRVVDKYFKHGFSSLNPTEQVFYCVWAADGEVGNGGMHAVCYNSSGNELAHFPAAFEAIGATQKAQLFQKLIEAFQPEKPSQEHEKRVQQHKALSQQAKSQIDDLDEEYFASKENIDDLLHQYWSVRPVEEKQ